MSARGDQGGRGDSALIRRDSSWLAAVPGAALWACLVLAPLVWLYAGAVAEGGVGRWFTGDLIGSAAWSVAVSAGVAAVAVVLGYVPGAILGTARRGQGVLLLVLLMPLLLPPYLCYYAWSLVMNPAGALGSWLMLHDLNGPLGRLLGLLAVTLWFWPLAALLIGQGWRQIDGDTAWAARLDCQGLQRFWRIELPLLARPIGLAFAVCFVLAMAEFGAFHLAGIRTLGTELSVVYQQTGSSSAVAWAAWPTVVLAGMAAVLLWRSWRDWSVGPAVHRARLDGRWRWVMVAALLAVSLAAPVGLLLVNVKASALAKAAGQLAGDWSNWSGGHAGDTPWSLLTSVVGAAATLAMAGAALRQARSNWGRRLSAVMQVSLLVATFLPGSLVAVGLLSLVSALPGGGAIAGSWIMVSAGLAARFAGLAMVVLKLAREGRQRHLDELAAVDGASAARAWWHVQLPGLWPVVAGAMLMLVMLGLTELPATMVLLPPGLPSFAQTLLNQMHYSPQQDVIASSLVLVAVYAVVSGAALTVIGWIEK